MVFGIISHQGPEKLVRINGNMDAEQYIKILEENLLTIEDVREKVFM
jgi:hypothetical protein